MAKSMKKKYYLEKNQARIIMEVLGKISEDCRDGESERNLKWLGAALGISNKGFANKLTGRQPLDYIEAAIIYNSLGRREELDFLLNYIGPHDEILSTHDDYTKKVKLSEEQSFLIRNALEYIG